MVKVSELDGALLDYWVAWAERLTEVKIVDEEVWAIEFMPYRPSMEWAQGGPLIDKYEIEISGDAGPSITAELYSKTKHQYFTGNGNTPLQAICRAVVRAAFGDEVEEVS